MDSVSEKLSRESWAIVHKMKALFKVKFADLQREMRDTMKLPIGDRRIEAIDRANAAIDTVQFVLREIEKRRDKKSAAAGWLVLREVVLIIQNRLRGCEPDLKRIAKNPASERRTKRILEIKTRKELLTWVVGEVNKMKEQHCFNELMKEKIRVDATNASRARMLEESDGEKELTDAELMERIAEVQARWTPEDWESKYEGPKYNHVEIRVCKVLGSREKLMD